MNVLKLTPGTALKIIQDLYRSQYPTEKYVVVMFQGKIPKGLGRQKRPVQKRTNYNEFIIAKSLKDLYIRVKDQFQIDKHIMSDINRGVNIGIKISYFRLLDTATAIYGDYIPTIYFGTSEDANDF